MLDHSKYHRRLIGSCDHCGGGVSALVEETGRVCADHPVYCLNCFRSAVLDPHGPRIRVGGERDRLLPGGMAGEQVRSVDTPERARGARIIPFRR